MCRGNSYGANDAVVELWPSPAGARATLAVKREDLSWQVLEGVQGMERILSTVRSLRFRGALSRCLAKAALLTAFRVELNVVYCFLNIRS